MPRQADRARRVRYVAVVLLVAAAGSGAGFYAYSQYTTHLTVSGINWQIFVNNTWMGFLFNNPEAGCEGQCPANAPVGSVWTYSLTFPFAAAWYNETVVNVTLPAPFRVLATSPPTPIELTGVGFAVSFRVSIQLPATAGTYAVTGAIWET